MATRGCSNTDHFHLIFGAIYLFFSFIASIGNGFILYIVKRDPLRLFNKPTNAFNIAIAYNYLFSAFIVLPFIGLKSILKSLHLFQELPDVVKLLEDFLVCFATSNLCLLFFAVFIERTTAFVFPVLNRKHVTMTRARRVCSSITGTCLLFSCIIFTGIPKNAFYVVFVPTFILLPCLGCLILPGVGFYGLKRQARKVASGNRNECLTCPMHNRKEKARRKLQINKYLLETSRTTLSVVIIWVFYCVVKFLESDVELAGTSCYELLEHLSFLLLFLPAAVNPIIMVRNIPAYWRSARHVWKRIRR